MAANLMNWRKLGVVFAPPGELPWMRSHASLPVAIPLGGDVYRVLFAARDDFSRSSVCALTLQLQPVIKVLSIDRRAVLEPGPLGHFDDHGVYPASIVRVGSKLWLYYVGWNPGIRRPLFYSAVGLAVGDLSGERFERVSGAPILARSDSDPCLVTSPCVRLEGDLWRMWYVSGIKWETTADGLQSYYHIKYAHSTDGVAWQRDGTVCIELQDGETNIGRPCVVQEPDGYRMWYCRAAGGGYRLGYGESADGVRWTRRDELLGIAPSASGWDSEAQAYPYVFSHKGVRYMLYNGNRFGQTGFGLAVQTSD